MTLFDPNDYTAPGMTPRAARAPRLVGDPPPATVPVTVDTHWRYTHRSTPGVVHYGLTNTLTDAHGRALKTIGSGGMVTSCGKVGTALSFEPGETVHGCKPCADCNAENAAKAARLINSVDWSAS